MDERNFNGKLLNQITYIIDIGKFDRALELLKDYISDNPKESIGYYLESYCLYNKKSNRSARESIEKALEISPNNHRYYHLYAAICEELFDIKKAEEILIEAIKMDTNNSSYLAAYGNFLLKYGFKEKGLYFIEEARKISPEDEEILIGKFNRYMSGEKLSSNEVKELSQEIQNSSFSDLKKIELQGYINYKNNDFKEAKKNIVNAFTNNPSDKELLLITKKVSLKNKRIFFLGRILDKVGRIKVFFILFAITEIAIFCEDETAIRVFGCILILLSLYFLIELAIFELLESKHK